MTNQPPPAVNLMCRRNAEGRIVALTRHILNEKNLTTEAWEPVHADDAEVNDFVYGVSSQALSNTDIGLARVLEDLIDVLINRGLLQFTDLPEAAQAKLLERRQTRANFINHLQPLLLDDDKGLF
jgi:hypothetical protein